jgi:hypothetical protein
MHFFYDGLTNKIRVPNGSNDNCFFFCNHAGPRFEKGLQAVPQQKKKKKKGSTE